MNDHNNRLDQLQEKLEFLLKQQENFYSEIKSIQSELTQLKEKNKSGEQQSNLSTDKPKPFAEEKIKTYQQQPDQGIRNVSPVKERPLKKIKSSNLEKFIAENLISIVGIIIIVIGVGIGAKIAIDRNLIGPVVRIIFGYLFGLGLTFVAIWLRKKYEGFSAVILSGSMAIMYLITFAAYSYYKLFPQELTFGMLVLFTIFTVVASLFYDRQLIAHIGLVGAYCVPWLLSDNSGRILIMFSYMTIINIGILFIAIKRYWKPLYIMAFSITWMIYLFWYSADYSADKQFGLAFTFLSIFFLVFFFTFLLNKIINKGKFEALDIILFISNSFVFFGLGCSLLNERESTTQLLGLFTLATALIHFFISISIYFNKLIDRGLYYLMAGLVLVFITIAFPVQLDGRWVTMLWAGEAALLFWIGRTIKIRLYEYLSYPMILLAFFSLIQDWSNVYNASEASLSTSDFSFFWNINFFSSFFVIACYTFIFVLDSMVKYRTELVNTGIFRKIMSVMLPVLLIITAYFAVTLEIAHRWEVLYYQSAVPSSETTEYAYSLNNYNFDFARFKTIWIINFTLFFVSFLSHLLIILKRPLVYSWIAQSANAITLLVFLIGSLLALSNLRESYLFNEQNEIFQHGIYNISIRYLSLLFVSLLLVSMYRLYKYMNNKPRVVFGITISASVLWILCSELLHWLDIFNLENSYKLGLSIFFGFYALFMVIVGIWKDAKHIRLSAFTLIGITLLKLFFYDLSNMTPISRAFILIILGLLMLGVSFLYIKYKNEIFHEKKD